MKKQLFDKYVKAVATQFHFTIEEMFMKSKRRDIVDARQILYYLSCASPLFGNDTACYSLWLDDLQVI